MLDRLLAMLESGQDSAMLRFSLGREYARRDRHGTASEHLARAVALQPDYSAAWKAYGQSLAMDNQAQAAMEAYRKGIAVAEENGDRQAAKEMQVFLRRLERNTPQG